MNTLTRPWIYGAGLAVVFGGSLAIGQWAGPLGATGGDEPAGHAAHGGDGGTAPAGPVVPGGLQISQDGYTLVPETTTVRADRRTDFRFSVTGPDGRPVTRYTTIHGKKLHFIVARRDLSGFQHLHPTEAGNGTWTVPLTLPEPGTYRVFTDLQPAGVKEQLTLGMDVSAPGDLEPEPLPKAERAARVGDYEVKLDGALVPGRTSKLTLTVSRNGAPVTDLEPYLEAYGHLVALRSGDLAYLHVHPDGEPGDGRTRPGPQITFYAEVPSTGAYRLYLDFQHRGKVRTAEFTAVAGPAKVPAEPAGGHEDDGHGH
ncbi:hypothetical protein DPM19_02835 [Actinomadura craniellae]|uniref:Heavy-metal-associated domain-containing protein n=1 Tax=Actinomadura craniellae TaxID=2231787 RepID=A0A365HDA5_9ACTN|nr:hypothetical protein [Actinomadura craniellae]RAY17110.1 hypothetical protein DPM19_02835 [Actinomadura craniellae]